jgi:hypothetical protein
MAQKKKKKKDTPGARGSTFASVHDQQGEQRPLWALLHRPALPQPRQSLHPGLQQ